jgi:hypothetical protein
MCHRAIRVFAFGFLVTVRSVQWELLASIILALVRGGTAGFREMARNFPGSKSAAARLSEVYRLCRWLPSSHELAGAIVHLLVSNARGRVVLANDWTEICGVKALMTALVTPSRAIPLLWTLMPPGGDQVALETEHYLDLQRVLPSGLQCVVLADRGFGHSRVIKSLQFCCFVLRSKTKVHIRKPGDERFTALSRIGYHTGEVQDFGEVDYCASNPVRVRVVRVRGVGQKEPWILLTNLDAPAKTITRLYAARFRIEQMFRDFKSGLHLRGRYYGSIESFDRMLAMAACAYVLLQLAGLHAKRRGWHSLYQTDSERQLAGWRIGRFLALDTSRGALVQAQHLLAQAPNVTLKTGQWDWTPRPGEQLGIWPELTGAEVPPQKRSRGTRAERSCDAALRLRLRQLLLRSNRTQKALAEAIGMRYGHLCAILQGYQPAAACWIPRFAVFLGISTAELLGATGWVPARRGGRRT